VISDLFLVNNEENTISMIQGGISVLNFFNSIEVVTGATATLVDQLDVERTFGPVKYDDQLVVVSEDQSAERVYDLTFLDEVIINSAPLVEVAFADSSIAAGATIMLSATASDDGYPLGSALSYQWSVTSGDAGNVSIASSTEPSTDVTFSAEGTYTLTIEVSDGELESSESVTVTVGPTGIDPSSALGMRIYPNPAREIVTVELRNMDPSSTTLEIIDLTGKTVYNSRPVEERFDIEISGFEAGIYYVSVRSGHRLMNQKLFIAR
jgi:hypothetical protein